MTQEELDKILLGMLGVQGWEESEEKWREPSRPEFVRMYDESMADALIGGRTVPSERVSEWPELPPERPSPRGIHDIEMGSPAVPPPPMDAARMKEIDDFVPDEAAIELIKAAAQAPVEESDAYSIPGGMISRLGGDVPQGAYGDLGPMGDLGGGMGRYGPNRELNDPRPGGTFSESNPSQMPELRPMFDMSRITVPRNEFDYTPGVGGTMQRRDVVDPQRLQMAVAEMQRDVGMGNVGMRGAELEQKGEHDLRTFLQNQWVNENNLGLKIQEFEFRQQEIQAKSAMDAVKIQNEFARTESELARNQEAMMATAGYYGSLVQKRITKQIEALEMNPQAKAVVQQARQLIARGEWEAADAS